MAQKEFHLRANEIRAESRALMLKIRTERLANSRRTQKAVVENVISVGTKAPIAPIKSAKPVVKTPVVPVKAASSIIVSRKVNAAVGEEAAIVPPEPGVEAVVEAEAISLADAEPVLLQPIVQSVISNPNPVMKNKAQKATRAQPAEGVIAALPVAAIPVVKARKPKPSKPAMAAMLVDAGVLIQADALIEAEAVKPAAQSSVQKAECEPTIKTVEAPIVGMLQKLNGIKPKRSLKPVANIPVEGLGTVAELMEAVAASVRAPLVASRERLERTVVLSGRALVPVSTVPSLGPGMIWRLNQVGVKTLADLANIEPDDLRAKLGPVARLVRVENWIAFARAA